MQVVPSRVSLITIGVADVGRATTFYESLGWPRSSASTPEVSFFQMAGVVLALWGRADLAADAAVSADGSGFRSIALAINVGSPAEVDAAHAAWVAAGGDNRVAPHRTEWGGYSCYVADLDGHLWEIAHNPHWALDDRGLHLP